MAERLNDVPPPGVGENGIQQAQFLSYVDRHADIERELAEAQETVRSIRRRRSDLRKTMKADGVNIPEFDNAITDAKRSGEEREANDAARARYREWLRMPVGFQPSMDLKTDDATTQAVNVHMLKTIDNQGYDAGLTGDRADTNPHEIGSEEHQRWHNAWMRGQEKKVEGMNGHAPDAAPKRRGRPRKDRADEASPAA